MRYCRVFFLLLIFPLFNFCSSKIEQKNEPSLMDLVWVDSLQINENNNFFSGSLDVQLIGDSLMAVSSFKTPGIWYLDVNNGNINYRIADGDVMDISIYPSAFNSFSFPYLYILDPRQNAVFKFDVKTKSLLGKVELKFPNEKMIRSVESLFWIKDQTLLIELFPSLLNHNEVDFYSRVDELIGKFDEKGLLESKFLFFPKELQGLDYPITPYLSFSQSSNPEFSLKIAFPASLEIYEVNNANNLESIPFLKIPNGSRYFNSLPAALPKQFNPLAEKYWQVPNSHFFKKIIENDSYLVIQTIMRNNDNLDDFEANSHLFIYDKEKKKWSETAKPLNINRMGYLAGIIKNELIFFEGSQKNSELKYIKRAVLRAIED